ARPHVSFSPTTPISGASPAERALDVPQLETQPEIGLGVPGTIALPWAGRQKSARQSSDSRQPSVDPPLEAALLHWAKPELLLLESPPKSALGQPRPSEDLLADTPSDWSLR